MLILKQYPLFSSTLRKYKTNKEGLDKQKRLSEVFALASAQKKLISLGGQEEDIQGLFSQVQP